jgi:hypothetical protein
MWPSSTRVNKPENDDPSIVKPIELAPDAAWAEHAPSKCVMTAVLALHAS